MKIVWFLFLMLVVTSCGLAQKDKPSPKDKQTLANEVRNQTFKQLKEELDLKPFGVGARMMDQIKLLGMNFHYDKEVDIYRFHLNRAQEN